MKTIKVYLLQQLVFYSSEEKDYGLETKKLTINPDKAEEWLKKGVDYEFESLELELPVQVQLDY